MSVNLFRLFFGPNCADVSVGFRCFGGGRECMSLNGSSTEISESIPGNMPLITALTYKLKRTMKLDEKWGLEMCEIRKTLASTVVLPFFYGEMRKHLP